jgi:hypothetical protein
MEAGQGFCPILLFDHVELRAFLQVTPHVLVISDFSRPMGEATSAGCLFFGSAQALVETLRKPYCDAS